MTSILFFIVGIALGFFIRDRIKRNDKTFSPREDNELDEMREEAHEALKERTADRKEKILDFMKNEMAHQEELKNCNIDESKVGVNREDVEELLEVSDNTARKYLSELEKENKIKQIGEKGRDAYYVLVY